MGLWLEVRQVISHQPCSKFTPEHYLSVCDAQDVHAVCTEMLSFGQVGRWQIGP
jgi:hypothetical protein